MSEIVFPSTKAGNEVDRAVTAALSTIPGQITQIDTRVTALEEDVDDLSGLPAQVTQIGSKIDDLDSQLNGGSTVTSYIEHLTLSGSVNSGGIVRTTGDYLHTDAIAIDNTWTQITAKVTAHTSYAGIVFSNSSALPTSSNTAAARVVAVYTGSGSNAGANEVVTVSSSQIADAISNGALYVYIGCYANNDYQFDVTTAASSGLAADVEMLKTAVTQNTDEISDIEKQVEGDVTTTTLYDSANGTSFENAGFLYPDGRISSSTSNVYSDYISLANVTELEVKATFGNSYGGGIAFYDSDKNFISLYYNVSGTSNTSVETLSSDDFPANAAYCRANAIIPSSGLGSHYVIVTTVDSSTIHYRVGKNEENIEDLRNSMSSIETSQENLELQINGSSVTTTIYDSANELPFENYGFIESDGSITSSTSSTSLYSDIINIRYATSLEVKARFGNPYGGGIAFYDKDMNFISSIYNTVSSDAYNTVMTLALDDFPEGAIYCRVSAKNPDNGSGAGSYYVKVTAPNETSIPQRITVVEDNIEECQSGIEELEDRASVLEDAAENIIVPSLVLPTDLYLKDNRTKSIYFNQAINDENGMPYLFKISSTTYLKVYDRLMKHVASALPADVSQSLTMTLLRQKKQLYSAAHNIHVITSPSSAKTLNILNSGDSISDLGRYQVWLTQKLEEDNITPNWIGTMSHITDATDVGAPSTESINEEICNEVLSGGTMTFLTQASGAAVLLNVSGISELPKTVYPGTQYLDSSGGSWVVRGWKFTQDSETGLYSGVLKLGKFKADPNYGDGTSSDTSSDEWTGGDSGTITKTASANGEILAGDSTIAFSSYESVYFNPFWNPTSKELDFSYYIDKWGFEEPDVLLLLFGGNDVGTNTDDTTISEVVARAKTIIDKFHEEYPNAYVVFGMAVMRAQLPVTGGYSANTNYPRKAAAMAFAAKMKEVFETMDYSFVYLVPLYAMLDAIYGFNTITTVAHNPYYNATMQCVNGDGVHPYYTGCKELGDAFEPLMCLIAKNL